MTVIAMTREMGTLGKEVAQQVARMLDAEVVHHELVEMLPKRSERSRPSEVTRHLEGTAVESAIWKTINGSGGYLTTAELLELAATGSVIIRGWGAAPPLRQIPHILTVRVRAPMAFRIQQMTNRLGVPEVEARREIERSDSAHYSVFSRLFSTSWRDPDNYDIVLDTGRLPIDLCARILVEAARSEAFRETNESRKILDDKLLEARVANAIQGDIGSRGRNVYAAVRDGNVRLYGVVRSRETAQAIEHLVRTLSGVAAVENDINSSGGHTTA